MGVMSTRPGTLVLQTSTMAFYLRTILSELVGRRQAGLGCSHAYVVDTSGPNASIAERGELAVAFVGPRLRLVPVGAVGKLHVSGFINDSHGICLP